MSYRCWPSSRRGEGWSTSSVEAWVCRRMGVTISWSSGNGLLLSFPDCFCKTIGFTKDRDKKKNEINNRPHPVVRFRLKTLGECRTLVSRITIAPHKISQPSTFRKEQMKWYSLTGHIFDIPLSRAWS